MPISALILKTAGTPAYHGRNNRSDANNGLNSRKRRNVNISRNPETAETPKTA
jgi:hypothetical protein